MASPVVDPSIRRKRSTASCDSRTPPIKSDYDKRSYRVVDFANGLKATLVCTTENVEDSKKGRFAATVQDARPSVPVPQSSNDPAVICLVIGCGSFQDDPAMEGITHFIEHMVFWGSEKYPGEENMMKFLYKHGASKLAFTLCEASIFEISIVDSALPEAMDRLAHMFIKPSFSRNAITTEIQSIDAEFCLRHDVNYRLNELLSLLAEKDHPMSRFRCGSSETLMKQVEENGFDLREKMLAFFQHHYTADVMTLCVMSSRPLDELEQLVKSSFALIPRRPETALVPISYPATQSPFGQGFAKLYKMITYDQDSIVAFQWALPSQRRFYKEKAVEYLGYILAHKCRGSLRDQLTSRGWALKLSAGTRDELGDNPFCTMFEIAISLTTEGVRHISSVAILVHQFLHRLRKTGPEAWLWNELKDIAQAHFRFMPPIEPVTYAQGIALGMQYFPEEHYLCGSTLYLRYDPAHIQNLMNLLSPDKCCTVLISSQFLKEADLFELTEPRMGTPYKVEDYPIDWRIHWRDNPEFQQIFCMPEKNPFMAMDFSLVQVEPASMRVPELLAQSDRSRLWYYRDGRSRLPYAHVNLHLISQLRGSANNFVCDQMIELIYAELLSWADGYVRIPTLSVTNVGLEITFRGYQEKVALVVQISIGALLKFDCSEEIFERVRFSLMKKWLNEARDNALLAIDTLRTIIDPDFTSVSERYERLKALTRADVMDRVRELCKGHLEAYVYGNMTAAEARALISYIEAKITTVLLRGRGPRNRRTSEKLIGGRTISAGEAFYVRILSCNPGSKCSKIINYYKYGSASTSEEILLNILEVLMRIHSYHILRTTWQLGYDPDCTFRNVCGGYALTVSISPMAQTFSLTHVDEKIDEFLDLVTTEMSQLDKDDFAKAKEILIRNALAGTLQSNNTFAGEKFWRQIRAQQYNFDANAMPFDFTSITELKHDAFKTWAVDTLKKLKHRKLSAQVVGFGEAALEECDGGADIWKEFNLNPRKCVYDDEGWPAMRLLVPREEGTKHFLTDFNLLTFVVRTSRASIFQNEC